MTQVQGDDHFVLCYTLHPKSICDKRKGVAPTCLEVIFLYIVYINMYIYFVHFVSYFLYFFMLRGQAFG